MSRVLIALLTAAVFSTGAIHADEIKTPAARYTFSWPLGADQLQPRGGSTRGAQVTLDLNPSPAWLALQETGIGTFERDRRAILAMAGIYRATFDFLEVVAFDPQAKAQAPYQSWGTEKIYVDVDSEKFISLVHILEMRIVEKDGSISEPFVTKHWRQDWRFEPTEIIEYQGNDRWQRRSLKPAPGSWSQTVYQVDESPRYASVGRWEHGKAFSSWLSGDTWRPLPRREWSARNDYQVLLGSNRHTVTATGWVQEENNLKGVLTAGRELDINQPYRAREYGVARYEHISSETFSEADRYFEKTRPFWNEVRDAWANAFRKNEAITLRGPVDKLGLFMPLFERAEILATETVDTNTVGNKTAVNKAAKENAAVIRAALNDMGVPN